TRFSRDWSSDVCSSDLPLQVPAKIACQVGVQVGVDIAAAGAHYQTLQRRHAHAGVQASAIENRAGRAAIAQVRREPGAMAGFHRSEERRVGKEWSARLS